MTDDLEKRLAHLRAHHDPVSQVSVRMIEKVVSGVPGIDALAEALAELADAARHAPHLNVDLKPASSG